MEIIDIDGGVRFTGEDAGRALGLLKSIYGNNENKNNYDDERPTPAPDNIIGTTGYYDWRDKDSKRRTGTSPDYYLGYGGKYANRFTKETYHRMSSNGQLWLLKTFVLLQKAIEEKLNSDPFIERNNSKFTEFAFSSHVPAYENAGVLKLGVMDKVRILLTPDAADLLSPLGIKQAEKIAADQFQYYKNHPLFAMKQAYEATTNMIKITEQVINYSMKQGIDAKQIWKLVRQWVIQ